MLLPCKSWRDNQEKRNQQDRCASHGVPPAKKLGARKNKTRSTQESMSAAKRQVNAEDSCSSELRGGSPGRIDESGHFARAGARVWAQGQTGRGFRRRFWERRRGKVCG